LLQSREVSALGEQFEAALERGHSQGGLPGQDAGTSGLKVKHGRTRSAARRGCFGHPLEEFTGAPILAFIEGKDRFL
jgi:hypothetical protein